MPVLQEIPDENFRHMGWVSLHMDTMADLDVRSVFHNAHILAVTASRDDPNCTKFLLCHRAFRPIKRGDMAPHYDIEMEDVGYGVAIRRKEKPGLGL